MATKRPTLIFYDDSQASDFHPLSFSHCCAELICGSLSLGEKWAERVDHAEVRTLTRPEIAPYLAAKSKGGVNNFAALESESVYFINARFLADDAAATALRELAKEGALYCDGELVALAVSAESKLLGSIQAQLKSGADYSELVSSIQSHAKALPRQDVKLIRLGYLWDLVANNAEQIVTDFKLLRPRFNFKSRFEEASIDDDCLIYNLDDVHVAAGARIDGQVVLDARDGPIMVGRRAYIAPHTRVEGPAHIGDDCRLVGGKIRVGCSFGPNCRIGGEVEESIFLGFSNKYHDGFIGHAYIGEWVNFGAMTTNSDLKNNYGKIKVELPSGLIDTGLNKVGSFVGDHSKTGIGTLLTTGMVIGFSANIFGGGLSGGRYVPSFLWGGPGGFVEYELDRAIETAKVVLARREQVLGAEAEKLFAQIFEATAGDRSRLLKSLR